MKPFKSRSQAAQDRLVYELIVKPENLTDGTFLDIGACHPIEISNTYALEQLGWRGLLIDNDPGAIELCKAHRQSPAILGDATMLDWHNLLLMGEWSTPGKYGLVKIPFKSGPALSSVQIDYLSFDIDAASLPALRRFPFDVVKFRVLTVETDVYRFGQAVRDEMRSILKGAGYDLVCADVCSSEGLPYEDWHCCPELSERADRFRCVGKKWTEIFPQ